MKQSVYSVSSLVHYIKESLDHDLHIQSILLKGEISNFTNHRSGHWYFTLKDQRSKISCVMFASYASRSKIFLKEGMKVIVSASVSMYEAGGNIQLYVTSVQVDGLGDLFLQLEQVKSTLSNEGLFAVEHKKRLPAYPMHIGVITAKTGAAIQDILTTIARRWPLANVIVYPTLVQGVQATDAIVTQLEKADRAKHDVILLARGGGAIEDLWCFNEETLARKVYHMNTVIVTGVGHESDTTLVDYVSDARAATPTAAAELITPDIEDVQSTLLTMKQRIQTKIHQSLNNERQRFDYICEHRYLKDPLCYISEAQMKLAMHVRELGIVEVQAKRLEQELHNVRHELALKSKALQNEQQMKIERFKDTLRFRMEQFEKSQQDQMKQKIILLDAYSPLKILSRGYHITYHDGHIVKRIGDVEEHDEIQLRMQDGNIQAKVVKKEEL